jgi:predicted XRE-type DNA-binding protein
MPKRSTRKKGVIIHERSSGNVFADVGLPEEYLVKAELVAWIDQIISDRHMTQSKAAELLGIDQPRVSSLFRGKLDLFSFEKLIDFVKRLGNEVEISIRPSSQPRIRIERCVSPEGVSVPESTMPGGSTAHTVVTGTQSFTGWSGVRFVTGQLELSGQQSMAFGSRTQPALVSTALSQTRMETASMSWFQQS